MIFNAFFSRRKSLTQTNKSQSRKPRRAFLELQLLEDRLTPASAGSQAIITQAYPGLLDRPVDPSGLSTWSGLIDQGFAPAIAAYGIQTATSQEWNQVQINQLYSLYLGRAPVTQDAVTWMGFLQGGGTYHQMVVLISSSDEAFAAAGGTNDAWLGSLFKDALGRPIDSTTQTQLDKLFTAGLNRAQVATIVLNTPEYYANLVQTSYQTLLGRPADGPSLVFQVNALMAGFTYQDLLAGIVGSPEFAAQANGATTTTVVAAPTTAVATQPITFTATVTPSSTGAGEPTGTVTFQDNGSNIGTGTVDASGHAIFTTSSLIPGTHTITASYGGGGSFGASSGTTTVTVSAANTSTALTSSANPAVVGQPVTLTATVTVQAPGSGFAFGTVKFTDQTSTTSPVDLGTGTINALTGVATLNVSSLALGDHKIVATYVPDSQGTFNASTSQPITQTISKAGSTTAVTSSTSPSVFGQSVTFTATVAAAAPGSGTPTGTVTFTDTTTGTTLGTSNLASGVATLAVSSLTAGSHTITANYSGDPNFGVSSGSTTQVVNQSVTSTAVTTSVATAVFGQSVTVTATVTATAPGHGTPTGTVTFTDENNNQLGTATLDNTGKGSINVSTLAVGGHTISVNYGGDTNFASSGGTAPLTITQATTTTVNASSVNPSVFGQSVNFTATVTANAPGGGIPTGTVTFIDTTTSITLGTAPVDGAGHAVLSVANLSVGTHSIAANYGGSNNYVSSSGSVDQVVNKANTTTVVIASQNPINSGASVDFTATVSASSPGAGVPTGTVHFVDTTTGTDLGTGTLDNTGKATITTTALTNPPASHHIQATYNGDVSFNTSVGSIDEGVN